MPKYNFLIKLQGNFIEIALWHGCSPVNLLHIFRKPYSKNTSRGPLLRNASTGIVLARTLTKSYILK